MVVETIAIDRLPSAPQALLEALELLQRDAGHAEISAALCQDAVISARVLSAAAVLGAASAGMEEAVASLGIEQLRGLLYSVGIRQRFAPASAETAVETHLALWRGSLRRGRMARDLAALTGYARPDEAQLAGLLAGLGEFVLLDEYGSAYEDVLRTRAAGADRMAVELQRYGSSSCDIGADLAQGWHLSSFFADAIRYRYEDPHGLLDAHPLVKLIHSADRLASAGALTAAAMDAAARLLDLDEATLTALCERHAADSERWSTRFKLQSAEAWAAADARLEALLGEIGELAQIRAELPQADSAESLLAVMQRSLALSLGIAPALLFLHEEDQRQLVCLDPGGGAHADFMVRPEPGRSLISDAFVQNEPLDSREGRHMAIVDRQLLHYCQGEILVAWPLAHGDRTLGVVVFAVHRRQMDALRRRRHLMVGLFRLVAQALAHCRQRSSPASDRQAVAALYTQRIREAVHEASNPLSIIRNYLEMLRLKLGVAHEASESIAVIGEEITRVGDILKNLAQPPAGGAEETAGYEVNRVIADTARVIRDSLCVTKSITLQLDLDQRDTEIQGSAAQLKQVLTNLLKNAAEALDERGRIVVATDANISFDGREGVGISVLDNGPGIPEAIRKRLFRAGATSKGGDHAGLGLSIVKRLVDGMQGHIVCSSSAAGTEFQIFLPARRGAEGTRG